MGFVATTGIDEAARVAVPALGDNSPVQDQFGLPMIGSSLVERETNPEVHQANRVAVAKVAVDVFQAAVRLLSSREAKDLFKEVASGAPGRPSGWGVSHEDAELLSAYDKYASECPADQPPVRATFVRLVAPTMPKVGKMISHKAVEQRLARLLKRREIEALRQQHFRKRMRELGFEESLLDRAGT